jgi:hypothetical protein
MLLVQSVRVGVMEVVSVSPLGVTSSHGDANTAAAGIPSALSRIFKTTSLRLFIRLLNGILRGLAVTGIGYIRHDVAP